MINGTIPIEINQSLQVLLGGQLTSKLGSFFFITRIEPAFIKEGTFTGFLIVISRTTLAAALYELLPAWRQ